MWSPFSKKEIVKEVNYFNYKPMVKEGSNLKLTEQFKGEVESNKIKFPAELGEEHPFDFKVMEGLYKKFGFFTAVVDKYVDFVVGPGFYVECKDERAKEIIEQFMQDVNFDTLLRAWTKEALVKGNGFLEIGGSKGGEVEGLKVLNANYMYVVRDKKGVVGGFNQFKGAFDKFAKDKVIPFKPHQIAHVGFNIVGDCAYGQGIGYCSLADVNYLLQQKKDSHFILSRKANSPLHAKLGKVEGNIRIIPKTEDVTAFGQKLETMTNKTEWSTDPLVEFKVIDFGNIGDKFAETAEADLAMLMYIYQIPPELMGMANIPEGMAAVRMDAFERRIQSIQAELEKIIEQQIFKRVLAANGFVKDAKGTEVHVEFQWGRPSNAEKDARLLRLKEFMNNPRMSETLFKMMEQDVVQLLDYDEDLFETEIEGEEKEREKELQRQQPLVPGQNQGAAQRTPPKAQQPVQPKPVVPKRKATEGLKKKIKSKCKHSKKSILRSYEYHKECPHCTESYDSLNDIEEWLGFNYKEYLGEIEKSVASYDFGFIKATTESELAAGYLSVSQVEGVRNVLDKGFKKGTSITQMSKQVDKLDIPDLYRMTEDGGIKLGASGLPILSRSAEKRSMTIVRTEVTRLANMGAIGHYKAKGIERIKWVASYGERTCPDCEGFNNQIYEINSAPTMPFHSNCRCMFVAVTEVK